LPPALTATRPKSPTGRGKILGPLTTKITTKVTAKRTTKNTTKVTKGVATKVKPIDAMNV